MGYYSAAMRTKHVEILQRSIAEDGRGKGSGEVTFVSVGCVWAAVDWTRGMRAMREGALEAYEVVMIRMPWNALVNRDCRLRCNGKTYQIISMKGDDDPRENKIQITAQEITI